MMRSGSMWTFNVARAACRAAGRQVLPDPVPQTEEKMFAFADQAMVDEDTNKVRVLKVHSFIRRDAPRSRFINTRRDLRDALISYMRFMLCDFDQALSTMATAGEITEYYKSFEPNVILRLRYEDIVNHPLDVARDIVEFCGVDLREAEIENIVGQFEKRRVERLIRDRETDIKRRADSGEAILESELVPQRFQGDIVRAFDLKTGFQSGHVSGYRDGSWRELLTVEQQQRMHAVLGDWLRSNGYSVE
jgi:Sulfotransferase family